MESGVVRIAVRQLQKLGYRYIALGGMVPLKTHEILACLKEVAVIRDPSTRLHLLGVTRLDRTKEFRTYGVVSFDSTSPLRQAFKDDKDNYYTADRTYSAIRVPQVAANAKLRSRIVAGEVSQGEARASSGDAWIFWRPSTETGVTPASWSKRLRAYERIHDPRSDRSAVYLEILEARPWKDCPCDICRRLGIHVMLFRGAERNRRRGFHNLFVFYRRLRRETCLDRLIRGRVKHRCHTPRRNGTRNGATPKVLHFPALEILQGPGRILYCFAVDGKLLPQFTTVSRVRRGERSAIAGYQRPEVLSHIAEIRTYLESERPMIPNAVVVAFDRRVHFEPLAGVPAVPFACHGTLSVPFDPALREEERPGWVVDGQQRISAIREAGVENFPICVVAFVTDDDREQREQFILVNSTKPLPKGLIYELLPSTTAKLPSLLQHRRFPAHILDRLNHDEGSPLCGLIRTPTVIAGLIKDNSILKMLENSLSDGALYRFRGTNGGDADTEAMLGVLHSFWRAVADVFSEAWGISPRRSRLMHGAGIVSIGFVMDAIADRYRQSGVPTKEQFSEDLAPLRDACRWTDGYWDFRPGMRAEVERDSEHAP